MMFLHLPLLALSSNKGHAFIFCLYITNGFMYFWRGWMWRVILGLFDSKSFCHFLFTVNYISICSLCGNRDLFMHCSTEFSRRNQRRDWQAIHEPWYKQTNKQANPQWFKNPQCAPPFFTFQSMNPGTNKQTNPQWFINPHCVPPFFTLISY